MKKVSLLIALAALASGVWLGARTPTARALSCVPGPSAGLRLAAVVIDGVAVTDLSPYGAAEASLRGETPMRVVFGAPGTSRYHIEAYHAIAGR